MRRGWHGAAVAAAALLLVVVTLSACMQTNYRPLDAGQESETPFSRDVYYQLADTFYSDAPQCVIVLPPADAGLPMGLAQTVEQALALRLGQKFDRVIGPRQRRNTERELVLDVRDAVDRRYLARAENCPAYLEWRLKDLGDSHFLVWSSKQFGLEVKLARAADDVILWQAAHTTRRSEGGPPLTILSLPVAAAEATMFSQDGDQLPSMIDDVVRRLAVALPDVR
jgi:hypothetical protein